MGVIRKRGSIWYVDMRINGTRYKQRIGKSKHLAELALKDLEVKAERQQIGFLDRKEANAKAFLTDYLQYSKTNHRASTTIRYRSVIKNFLEFIEKIHQVVNLRDITPEVLERYKQHRKTSEISKNGKRGPLTKKETIKKGAKSHTVNFELGTLRTILNLAIRQKYLDDNPVREVGFLKPDDSKQRRFLTDAECDRLLRACEPEYYPIFFTFINTGMRKAELINLEWKDLDFKRRIIKIQRKSFWVPKTGEREIPMSEVMFSVLDNLPRQSHFVFPNEDGEAMSGNALRLELIRIAKNASIYDLTEVHALRHTFGSALTNRNVDLPTVQKLMGHSKIETTLIYLHQTTDHLREAVEKLSLGEHDKRAKTV